MKICQNACEDVNIIWTPLQVNLILLHANKKGTDQPAAHSHSLISIFVFHSLEDRLSQLATCNIPIFYLSKMATLKNTKNWFSRPIIT